MSTSQVRGLVGLVNLLIINYVCVSVDGGSRSQDVDPSARLSLVPPLTGLITAAEEKLRNH